jgi:hypothetical protein
MKVLNFLFIFDIFVLYLFVFLEVLLVLLCETLRECRQNQIEANKREKGVEQVDVYNFEVSLV